MAKDFTARELPADRLRERWAYHNVRVAIGSILGLALLGAEVGALLSGAEAWAEAALLAALVLVGYWELYHFGAARAITRISFGDDR